MTMKVVIGEAYYVVMSRRTWSGETFSYEEQGGQNEERNMHFASSKLSTGSLKGCGERRGILWIRWVDQSPGLVIES